MPYGKLGNVTFAFQAFTPASTSLGQHIAGQRSWSRPLFRLAEPHLKPVQYDDSLLVCWDSPIGDWGTGCQSLVTSQLTGRCKTLTCNSCGRSAACDMHLQDRWICPTGSAPRIHNVGVPRFSLRTSAIRPSKGFGDATCNLRPAYAL